MDDQSPVRHLVTISMESLGMLVLLCASHPSFGECSDDTGIGECLDSLIRGEFFKHQAVWSSDQTETQPQPQPQPECVSNAPPRRRGRPPKIKTPTSTDTPAADTDPPQ